MEQREQPVSWRFSRVWAVNFDHAFGDLGHFRASPALRAFPAESGIGEQSEGGSERLGPLIARGIVTELSNAPQSAARRELDAGRRMRRNRRAFAIDSRTRSD